MVATRVLANGRAPPDLAPRLAGQLDLHAGHGDVAQPQDHERRRQVAGGLKA
jgi:hypothetical protein